MTNNVTEEAKEEATEEVTEEVTESHRCHRSIAYLAMDPLGLAGETQISLLLSAISLVMMRLVSMSLPAICNLVLFSGAVNHWVKR